MTLDELLRSRSDPVAQKLQNKMEFRGETTYTLQASDLRDVAKFCRDDLSFDYLLDITSIDNFGEEPRFEILFHLYSMPHAVHLRIKLKLSEEAGSIETVSDIWPTADWHEREIYDMMGIKFKGHPDLRRILMWDGYPFFPLRKDFPLAGLPSDMPDVAFSSASVPSLDSACDRSYEGHTPGGRPLRYGSEYCRFKRSRASCTAARIIGLRALRFSMRSRC